MAISFLRSRATCRGFIFLFASLAFCLPAESREIVPRVTLSEQASENASASQEETLNAAEHPELVQRARSIALQDGVSVDEALKITKKEWGWLVLFKKPLGSAISWYTVAVFKRDYWLTGIEVKAYPLGYEAVYGKFAVPSADRSKLALFRYEQYPKKIAGAKELHDPALMQKDFVSPCTLFIWDTKKGAIEPICEAAYGTWHPIRWEKNRVAFIDSERGETSGQVVTVDLQTREVRRLDRKGILLAVSTDGKQVAWIPPADKSASEKRPFFGDNAAKRLVLWDSQSDRYTEYPLPSEPLGVQWHPLHPDRLVCLGPNAKDIPLENQTLMQVELASGKISEIKPEDLGLNFLNRQAFLQYFLGAVLDKQGHSYEYRGDNLVPPERGWGQLSEKVVSGELRPHLKLTLSEDVVGPGKARSFKAHFETVEAP